MSTHKILCGNCGAPVEGPEEPAANDKIICSKCGQSDTYADVIEAAKAFVTDEAAKSLSGSMANAFKGSKSVTYTPGEVPERHYRWTVADFRL